MEIGELLRSHGHRATVPRRLVWDVLAAGNQHLTAQQIADRVNQADPTVNVSSVYRTLGLFAELDLIRESNLGVDGLARYEPAHPDEHIHLVCESCGAVEHHGGDVVGRIRQHLGSDHGFAATSIDVVATGLCATCQSEAAG